MFSDKQQEVDINSLRLSESEEDSKVRNDHPSSSPSSFYHLHHQHHHQQDIQYVNGILQISCAHPHPHHYHHDQLHHYQGCCCCSCCCCCLCCHCCSTSPPPGLSWPRKGRTCPPVANQWCQAAPWPHKQVQYKYQYQYQISPINTNHNLTSAASAVQPCLNTGLNRTPPNMKLSLPRWATEHFQSHYYCYYCYILLSLLLLYIIVILRRSWRILKSGASTCSESPS